MQVWPQLVNLPHATRLRAGEKRRYLGARTANVGPRAYLQATAMSHSLSM